jgi:D-tyrosyl-tRNA(Tyr) deacylase
VFFPLLLLSVAAAVLRALTTPKMGLAAAQVVAVDMGGFKVVPQPMVVREHQVKVLGVVTEHQRLVLVAVVLPK